LLPKEIQSFPTAGVYDSDDHQHLSFIRGSHPYLVNEFLKALIEERQPYPKATQSANITCVGISAYESSMKGGEIIKLPEFTWSS
jgi:hypothetical protein